MPHRMAWLAALSLAACSGGLTENPPADADGDVDADLGIDGDAREDSDAREDADLDGPDREDAADQDDVDGDGPLFLEGEGPLTLLLDEMALSTERICDLDGDGDLDNAVADLGPAADLAAMAFSSAIRPTPESDIRYLIHFPLVADRGLPDDPEVVPIMLSGFDTGSPVDWTDDFSGHESFFAFAGVLDGCGEPRYFLREAAIAEGAFSASDGVAYLFLGQDVPFQRPRLFGTIAPGGSGADLMMCGAALVQDLGAIPGPPGSGELSMLEVFAAGGAPFGFPSLSGVTPDLDLDSDGLELFVLDEGFRIAACIDGDSTLIPGRECWRDPRVADAVSFTVHMGATTATFAGRQPGWESLVVGPCDDPPAESLFDPR